MRSVLANKLARAILVRSAPVFGPRAECRAELRGIDRGRGRERRRDRDQPEAELAQEGLRGFRQRVVPGALDLGIREVARHGDRHGQIEHDDEEAPRGILALTGTKLSLRVLTTEETCRWASMVHCKVRNVMATTKRKNLRAGKKPARSIDRQKKT